MSLGSSLFLYSGKDSGVTPMTTAILSRVVVLVENETSAPIKL